MFASRFTLAACLILAGGALAIACGPDFPWQLLDNRNNTLKATPANTFAFEAQHLTDAPADHFKPKEPQSSDDRTSQMSSAENAGLSAVQVATLGKMRAAATGDEAFQLGDGLSDPVRAYTAGAVDFNKGNLPAAKARFASVLAMPPGAAASRSVWAAYMIGRTDARANDEAGAAAAFQQTRSLVKGGAPDSLGFAVASYGEEARLHFNKASGLLTRNATKQPPPASADGSNDAATVDASQIFTGYDLTPQNEPAFGHEIAAAVALYANQAAFGSDSAVQSLRIMSESLLSDPARIDAAVSEPQVQRLLVVYALARLDDVSRQDNTDDSTIQPDAGTRDPGVTPNKLLPALVAAIEKHGVAKTAAADRLAALCYRVGRYDLAGSLARVTSSPLADWVLAKLAVQRGDLATAEKYYVLASRGFPLAGPKDTFDSDNSNRVVGESTVVALARGEYVDAFDKLYPVANVYWGDFAYMAERVLTTDELKAFVDTQVPVSNAPTPGATNYQMLNANVSTTLRNLLARRLMRDGRTSEAGTYFHDDKLRAAAQSYAQSVSDGKNDWGRVDRAQALFAAAQVAHNTGMDILGYEEAPDFNVLSGEYDTGVGQAALQGPFISKDERARFAASRANPDLRYHYRFIAVDEVKQAAALLPARSQAYAAVLCKAVNWMMQTPDQDAQVKALYRLYITKGAHMPWASHFGHNCPNPDFNGAIAREHHEQWFTARKFASHNRWWLVAFVLLLMGAVAFLVFQRAQSRRSA